MNYLSTSNIDAIAALAIQKSLDYSDLLSQIKLPEVAEDDRKRIFNQITDMLDIFFENLDEKIYPDATIDDIIQNPENFC